MGPPGLAASRQPLPSPLARGPSTLQPKPHPAAALLEPLDHALARQAVQLPQPRHRLITRPLRGEDGGAGQGQEEGQQEGW